MFVANDLFQINAVMSAGLSSGLGLIKNTRDLVLIDLHIDQQHESF